MPSDEQPTAELEREVHEALLAALKADPSGADILVALRADLTATLERAVAREAEITAMRDKIQAQLHAFERELVEMNAGRAYTPEELAIIQAGEDRSRAATARALAALRAARDAMPLREALRNRHSTYQLTNDQRDRIKELALVLKLGAYEELATVGESEIVRTAVEHFLALNGATQLALLRDNRATEKKSKYGLYTPREPGEE